MFVRSCLTIAVLAATTLTASAATVINGSFEDAPSEQGRSGTDFNQMNISGRTWDIWNALPGWDTTTGRGVEVQSDRTLGDIDAHSGNHYLELDTTRNSGITQSVYLNEGKYELSFWYAPRSNNSNSNGISFGIGNMFDTVAGPSGEFQRYTWTEVVRSFSIDSAGTYDLTFAATQQSDGLGGLLDTIDITEIPLPASALLLLGGLGAIGALRRKNA